MNELVTSATTAWPAIVEPPMIPLVQTFMRPAQFSRHPIARPTARSVRSTICAEHTDKIKHVPKEVGAMLMTAGIMGVILPGPGIPAIIAGGLALWPGAFGKLESWLVRRNPKLHRKSVQQINRFLDDLERRYPNSTNP